MRRNLRECSGGLYDIVRPARVVDLLEDHAARVKDSVFEARLTERAADWLFRKIE